MNTLAGKMTVNTMVKLRDLRLPKSNKNTSIESHNALVFDTPFRYDIMFGTDFLNKVGMKMIFEDSVVEWYDSKLPLCDPRGLGPDDFKEMEDYLYVQIEDELFGEDWLDSYATTILDAKYEKADILEVVNNQKQLNTAQRNDLFRTLKKHESLFDGTLGVYPHKRFHIELELGHTTVHARAYPVPRVHLEVFRRESQHLCM